MGLITDTLHTIGDNLTNFVEHPSLDTFLDATPIGIIGSVWDNNVSPALDTLGNEIKNGFNDVVNDIGNVAGDVFDELKDLGGGVMDTLMMPLMVIGCLGLGFMLLQRK